MNRSKVRKVAPGVPDFGATIRRDRLLHIAGGLGDGALLIVAPSGYGKSVLAAQVASELFDEAVWISAAELPARPLAMLGVVARRLGAEVPDVLSGDMSSPQCDEDDMLNSIGESVRRALAPRLCVVLDDLDPDGTGVTARLARVLRRPAPARTVLVVTSRSWDAEADVSAVCVLGPEDLRLDDDEAARLIGLVSGAAADRSYVSGLTEATQGQAALLAVAARHGARSAVHGAACLADSEDVRGLLVSLATRQTDTASHRALYAAALLRSGHCKDVAAVTGHDETARLRDVSRHVPLLRVGGRSERSQEFVLHDLACSVFGSQQYAQAIPDASCIRERAIEILSASQRHTRALELILDEPHGSLLAEWLANFGSRLIREGHFRIVEDALAVLGPADCMRTRVLLVAARVAAEREDFEQALRRARVAHRLAAEESDMAVAAEALVLAARISVSQGRYGEASGLLSEILGLDQGLLTPDVRVEMLCSGGVVAAVLGDSESGLARTAEARRLGRAMDVSLETAARAVNYEAAVRMITSGDMARARSLLKRTLHAGPLSSKTREYTLGNYAGTQMEMGRIADSLASYAALENHCIDSGSTGPNPCFWTVKAACALAAGEAGSALSLVKESVAGCAGAGDDTNTCENLFYSSVMHMAHGDAETALGDAEESFEMAVSLGVPVLAERSAVQMRASLLALGDVAAARHVDASLAWAGEHRASHVALLANLVLGEIARLDGDSEAAVEHVSRSSAHLLSENANWLAAMYVRAFPGLLGVLSSALGSDKVPARLLKMLLPEHVAAAMPLARACLTPERWDVLARRVRYDSTVMLAGSDTARGAKGGKHASLPVIRARFFGGLEVTTPQGVVSEKAWRKRKARLLFAMLAVRRGRDVPREVILDRLWPDLDEGRARNNYYVTWSAMKAALMPGSPRGAACPWLESIGDICRTTAGMVRTDLDEFDETLLAARKAVAEGAGDTAIGLFENLAVTYRGELLPGDPYDDWFAATRDSYRHEFGDAMSEAASLAEEIDDPARALQFARLGLAQDPLREDLYQIALTHQIGTGQRSAAVETYFACRSKLVDDLGLDPSRETVRLYEQVLAMEDEPEPARGGKPAARSR